MPQTSMTEPVDADFERKRKREHDESDEGSKPLHTRKGLLPHIRHPCIFAVCDTSACLELLFLLLLSSSRGF